LQALETQGEFCPEIPISKACLPFFWGGQRRHLEADQWRENQRPGLPWSVARLPNH